jgi:hypothetical protein
MRIVEVRVAILLLSFCPEGMKSSIREHFARQKKRSLDAPPEPFVIRGVITNNFTDSRLQFGGDLKIEVGCRCASFFEEVPTLRTLFFHAKTVLFGFGAGGRTRTDTTF